MVFNKKRSTAWMILPILILMCCLLSADNSGTSKAKASGAALSDSPYSVGSQAICAAVSSSSSASFSLVGGAGQMTGGESASANYGLIGGFWEFSEDNGCCGEFTSGMTGNADCDGLGKRNLADITRLIDRVYISKADLCCEENGNIDGDIDSKINLADITKLIDHVYISKAQTAACE